MIETIVAALGLGLYAGLSPGPTLTLVVSQTLRHGRAEGLKVALSPLVADGPIVALVLVLLTRLGRSDGTPCWEATYPTPNRNDGNRYDARTR